jgi:hypothetical protein
MFQSSRREVCLALLFTTMLCQPQPVRADDAAQDLLTKVIGRAGGEPKLLSKFRLRERVLIQSQPAALPTENEPGNRTSVVEIGKNMWLGTKKRDKDKVRVLCWAWSLRLLLAPEAELTTLPETMIAGQRAVGLRAAKATKEPVDLWFDAGSMRLLAIDYTDTRHVFSDWTETAEGHQYARHVAGYRFQDPARKAVAEKQWYQTDLLELTPLTELPADLEK